MKSCAAVFADLVDLADVRMVDARRRARLAPEPLARRLVVLERQHHLQRDGPFQALIVRLYTTPIPPAPSLRRSRSDRSGMAGGLANRRRLSPGRSGGGGMRFNHR